MKKFLFSLLILVVALGLLAAAGFAGYRIGYSHGLASTGTAQGFNRPFQMHPQFMPHDGFGRGFDHYSMMRPGGFNTRGIGFFSPFHLLFNILLIGVVIWLGYKLFKGNGWQLSLTRKTANEVTAPETSAEKTTESKE